MGLEVHPQGGSPHLKLDTLLKPVTGEVIGPRGKATAIALLDKQGHQTVT